MVAHGRGKSAAEKSYKLCLININESVSTCLWKTTLESLVCPMVVWSHIGGSPSSRSPQRRI